MNGAQPQAGGSATDAPVLTSRNRLRVRPMWYNGLRCGQSFIDTLEQSIEYHIVPHDRYATFVEAGSIRFDLDTSGFPVMIEVDLSYDNRLEYKVLEYPVVDCVQRHRFLDFPILHRSPRIEVDVIKGLYHIVLSRRGAAECWMFAPGAAWDVDSDSCLVGLWLDRPIHDPSRCRRAAWRAGVWRAYRRGRLQELASEYSHPEHGWLSVPKIFP